MRVLCGRATLQLAARLKEADGDAVQQLLARNTANFKRGTERD